MTNGHKFEMLFDISTDRIPFPSCFSLQIIMEELYRNILLAFACIFVTTLLMLSSLIACLQVLLAVVLTLLNVSGMMYFWGECEVSVMSRASVFGDRC